MSAQNADYGRDDTPLCAPWHKDGKCPWYDHSDGSMHPAACGPRCRSQHTDDHSRCEQYDGPGRDGFCDFCDDNEDTQWTVYMGADTWACRRCALQAAIDKVRRDHREALDAPRAWAKHVYEEHPEWPPGVAYPEWDPALIDGSGCGQGPG